ncbi:MAG: hypothetical protein COT73_08335 [Bdellovibrio sp. CG10_big_fil_rev_8_21_14_0_10_47_8]|nr:MAG: hypothetical protein COT73_08335 [Bdellovibrio sp. CG10_big_fil_rev_8_21_14_0_10_47_8]
MKNLTTRLKMRVVTAGLIWFAAAFFFFMHQNVKNKTAHDESKSVSGDIGANSSEQSSQRAMASVAEGSSEDSTDSPGGVREDVKRMIESLFAEIESNPLVRGQILKKIKKLLHEQFQGQEGCWSCSGASYYQKYESFVGGEEANRPLGLMDWVHMGDEAFEARSFEESRKFYQQALQVLDERSSEVSDDLNEDILQRLQERCQELDCQ